MKEELNPIGQEWLEGRCREIRGNKRTERGDRGFLIAEVVCELAHIAAILDQIRADLRRFYEVS